MAPGDPIVSVGPPLELAHGRVASRSLDNRAGVYVAVETLRRLAAEEGAADVAVVAGAQEELGHSGVRPAMYTLRPDVVVALDVTWATDVPAGDAKEAGDHGLGTGPALFRGPPISPEVFELLVAAAEAEDIAHTVETGMKTFTDADDTFARGRASRPASSRSRCATCTPRRRSFSSPTSRTASGCSSRSPAGSSPAPTSVARLAR